jgi:hypothetical protein
MVCGLCDGIEFDSKGRRSGLTGAKTGQFWAKNGDLGKNTKKTVEIGVL